MTRKKRKPSKSFFKELIEYIFGEILWGIITFIPKLIFHFIKNLF